MTKNDLPRVLIATPIYDKKDYSLDTFLQDVGKISYPNYEHILIDNSTTEEYAESLKARGIQNVYHIKRGSNSREALARAQNFARHYALDHGFDYMFSLESDIHPPADVIQRLLIHNKEVITGLYMIGIGVDVPCITITEWVPKLMANGTRLLTKEEADEVKKGMGLIPVHAGGFGCCLIKKEILEMFSFRYDPRFQSHSDVYFFSDLYTAGIQAWVDTDIVCEHERSDWNKVEDR